MTDRPQRDQITIRSYPKVVFLYPVLVFSLICGTWQLLSEGGIESEAAPIAGEIFFVVLALNLLVISFEFSRFKTVAIFFFLLAVFFLLLYLGTRWQVLQFIRDFVLAFDLRVSNHFYFTLGTYLSVILTGVFITTRFDYWIVKSNEILHKEGFLGDVKRYPSPNLKMTKEINDVFEFFLLGAGRVVIYPTSEKQAIVLDHVLWVNSKERRIQDLLSSLSVEITGQDAYEDDEPQVIGG